jgi:type I restriction enzyme S subunit
MNTSNFKQTEIGLIPEIWEVVKLGEVANYINGYAFKPSNWGRTGLPIIRIQNLTDKTKPFNYYSGELEDKYKVKPGDILISWSASLGTFRWEHGEAWLNQHIFKVDVNGNLANADFFYLVMKYYIDTLLSKTRGTTMKHIVKKEFENSKIPLPPLEEQQKIARVLSTIQRAIEHQDKIIDAVRKLKKSLMHTLFTEGLDGEEQKETEVGRVPKNWGVVRLGDVATLQRGKDLPKAKRKKGNYPVVGSNRIVGYHDQYVAIGPGVLVGRSGSVGKTFYIESAYWPLNTSLWVKDFHGNYPKFVYYLFTTFDFTRYSTGVSVPTLNRNLIHPIKIPLPPLPEQQQIAHILSTVDKKIEVEERMKATLKELFKTMLHKLMSGEIRLKDVDI